MGDSSVSCVMSGMSMTDEKAVLIALAPASYYGPSRKRPGHVHGARVSGDEVNTLVPVLLPLFGNMDSYGRLEEIEKDEHTAFLEAKFNAPIEEIAGLVSEGARPDVMRKAARKVALDESKSCAIEKKVWDGRLFGCFVSREVWDRFSRNFINERGGPDDTVWDASEVGPEVLRGLGFKFVREDKKLAIEQLGPDHYVGLHHAHLYIHPSMPDVEAWCDANMSTEYVVRGKQLPHTYRLAQTHAKMQELDPPTGFPPKAIEWAKRTTDVTLNLMKARNSMRRQRKINKEREAYLRKHPEKTFAARTVNSENDVTYCDGRVHIQLTPDTVSMTPCLDGKACEADRYSREGFKRNHKHRFPTEKLPQIEALGWKVYVQRLGLNLSDAPILRKFAPEMFHIYGQKLLSKAFLPRAAELVTFARAMYATNKLFQPNLSGYQYGHLYLQRELAKVTHDVLDRHIKEREANR